MKICVVGEGAIGNQHLDALANIDGVEVVSLVGGNASNTREIAIARGIKYHTLDLAEALTQPDIHAVILASPTPLHFAQGKQVLLSGKHLLVEIPMADNIQDAQELAELAQSSGLIAMAGHLRRFNHSHAWLNKQFISGELQLQQLQVQTYFMRRTNVNALGQARTWTDHLLWHHACHTVDLFQYQTGEQVSECYVLQGPEHSEMGIAMDMSIALKVPSGALCTLSLSFNNNGPLGSDFRYICDNGTFHAHNDELFDAHHQPLVRHVTEPTKGLEIMDREFISAIKENRQALASLHSCLPAMQVLQTLEDMLLKTTHTVQGTKNG